ncbi:MAG: hypothetical protein ACR2GG_08900 [Gemmatimonadaceae bacterium]
MTGDVRAFYAAVGVELPDRAGPNVSVRCFLTGHEDRRASCSVSLEHGAFHCHGCGEAGGPYDAAVAVGLDPAAAMRLVDAHGLARDEDDRAGRNARRPVARSTPPAGAKRPARLPGEDTLARAADVLHRDGRALELAAARGWDIAACWSLGVGWADLDAWAAHGWRRGLGWRFTIPIRDAHGRLVTVVAYRPGGTPKSYAAPGRPRDLFPAPEPLRHAVVTGQDGSRGALLDCLPVTLVEGEPDVPAAATAGVWPAVAVPGAGGWKPEWPARFAGVDVRVLMDHDDAGRALAARVAGDLAGHARTVRTLDWPSIVGRGDLPAGYDFTDWRVGVAA